MSDSEERDNRLFEEWWADYPTYSTPTPLNPAGRIGWSRGEYKLARGAFIAGYAKRRKEDTKDIESMINEMADEFVGFWKFKTLDEGPENRRWCASVNVAGRLVDTEEQPTIRGAVARALEIVNMLLER